jgi:lipopolysaccharide export system protein LptA
MAFAVLISGLFLSVQAYSKTLANSSSKNSPMIITSRTLELDDELKTVTFTGSVNAKNTDFLIKCRKMVLYYHKTQSASKKTPETGNKIDKIVATDNVRIIRAQGGEATAQKAVYYQKDDRIVLTGNPVIKQGKSFVEGERITLYLKENRSIVESNHKKRVKAIIFSKHK